MPLTAEDTFLESEDSFLKNDEFLCNMLSFLDLSEMPFNSLYCDFCDVGFNSRNMNRLGSGPRRQMFADNNPKENYKKTPLQNYRILKNPSPRSYESNVSSESSVGFSKGSKTPSYSDDNNLGLRRRLLADNNPKGNYKRGPLHNSRILKRKTSTRSYESDVSSESSVGFSKGSMTPSCSDDNNLICTSSPSNTAPANTLSLLANNLSLHSEKYQIRSLIRPNVDNNHFYTIAVKGEVNPPIDFRKHFFQFTEPPRQPSNSANCLDPSKPVISTQVPTNSLQGVLNGLTPEVRNTHWFFSLLDFEDNSCKITMPVKWIPKQKRNAHNLMKNAHLFANRKSKICKFCFTNGEAKDIFSSHVTKSKQGETICPILRKHKCEICGATGIHAHTKSHCPLNKKQKIKYHKLVNGCLKP